MNDNVKKIFEMLGVEPNEKFKIEGIEEQIYYIDERLYVKRENERLYSDTVLSSLLNGNFKIIKLPKELKKKKLRDLTNEELQKWTEKNCKYSSSNLNYCSKCIFGKIACFKTSRCWLDCKDLYSDKFLDQEVEVE